jgi:chemosensory pili system protein ChpA (sensor histidine kinase/response regulator)
LVKQVVEVSEQEIEKARAKGALRLGNTNYTIFFLNELLGVRAASSYKDTKFPILLIESPGKSCALVVDQILKPQELVIKKLEQPLDKVKELIGATVLGDGSVLPIIDLIFLLKRKFGKPKKSKAMAAEAKAPFTVMIVDDSPSVRRVNSNLITKNGWQAIVAKDGIEAIEIIQKLTSLPNLILTDVEMPRMDGYELLASLKRQTAFADIPVVMITSRAGDKHRQKAFSLGVSEYLTKPYEDTKLIEVIGTLTQKK